MPYSLTSIWALGKIIELSPHKERGKLWLARDLSSCNRSPTDLHYDEDLVLQQNLTVMKWRKGTEIITWHFTSITSYKCNTMLPHSYDVVVLRHCNLQPKWVKTLIINIVTKAQFCTTISTVVCLCGIPFGRHWSCIWTTHFSDNLWWYMTLLFLLL